MKPVFRIIWQSLILFLLMTHISSADEILLENGDRITGSILGLADGKLTVSTESIGEIEIDWQKVQMLKTDAPIYVTFSDGTTRKTQAVVYRSDSAEAAPVAEATSLEAIEAGRIKGLSSELEPRVKVTARANAGLSNQRGNTDTDAYHVDAELITRTEKHRLSFGGELNNQKTDGDTTADNWLAFGKYDFFLNPQWFLYVNGLLEHDEFADLDLRTTLGAGAGYQIFEADDLNLSLSAGASYVKEEFIVAGRDEFSAGQWILRYDQTFFDNLFQLFHSDNGTVSFENADNWQIKTRQGMRFPLRWGLNATFQYNYDYNNDPSPEAESKWDSRLLFLLGFAFQN